jgi:hypothetical protein
MDAVKFVEERRRMFAVTGKNPKHSLFNMSTCAEDVVKEVEEWSAAHPRKTRQSVFLEQYPETAIDAYGVIHICPLVISATHRDSNGDCDNPKQICVDCRREFWMQEVE